MRRYLIALAVVAMCAFAVGFGATLTVRGFGVWGEAR